MCLIGFGKTNRHISRQDEKNKQQPVTVGHSIRMLAPRGSAKCIYRSLAWGGRWLTPSPIPTALEVQLQSKLNFSRVVRRVTRGSNFAKSRICEVVCAGHRDYAVAAESR